MKLAASAAVTFKSTSGISPVKKTDLGFEAECDFIAAQNQGKPITTIYEGKVGLESIGTPTEIEPDVASKFFADNVVTAIGKVWAVAKKKGEPKAPVTNTGQGGGGPSLAVQQPGWVDFDVKVVLPEKVSGNRTGAVEFSGRATIAQFGVPYQLPVPRPAAFGKQTFGAAFLESGALSSVQYSSAAGATQALGALNTLLTAAQGSTTAQAAAEVKAQADLIVQQQRLVLCQADPENCPK